MTRMEWMSAMDASFLHVENDRTPMHIGGVSIFEGPPPPFERLREMVAGKLDRVPRYDGGLYFGITGDYDSAADIDVLTAGIERGMEELLALVDPVPPARRHETGPTVDPVRR